MTTSPLFHASARALALSLRAILAEMSIRSHGRLVIGLFLLGSWGTGYGQDMNEPNDAFTTATTLTLTDLSVETQGTLDPSGDLDYYTLEIPQAGELVINSVVPANLRSFIVLYDKDRKEIARETGSTGRPDSLIAQVCKADTYYILFADASGLNSFSSEPYRLTVELDVSDIYECNRTFAEAAPVAIGDTINAKIRSAGDLDYYQIEVPQAGELVINSVVPANLRSFIVLYDKDRKEIARETGSTGRPDSLIAQVCEADTYYILFADASGLNSFSSEPYRLTVELDVSDIYECNRTFVEAAPVAIGDTINATIRSAGDLDYYQIEVPQAGELVINSVVPANLRSFIVLYDKDRKEIARETGSTGRPDSLIAQVCEADTYYILFADASGLNSFSSEPYRLTVELDVSDIYECNRTFAEAAPVAIGDTINATIRSAGDLDYYQLEVSQPGIIVINSLVPANLRSFIALYDKDRKEIARKTGSTGRPDGLVTKLCGVGTYYILFADNSGLNSFSSESYRLTVSLDTTDTYECNDEFADAKPVTLCDTIRGAIFPSGDEDYYAVSLGADDTLVIDFGDQFTNIETSIFGYNPDQSVLELSQDQPGDPIALVPQDSGSYFIQVTARNRNEASQQLYSLIFQTRDGCATTNTNELLTEGTMRLYPNPSGDAIWIAYGVLNKDVKLDLQILSADGRMLKRFQGVTDGQRIDLSSLPTGILLFQFAAAGEIVTRRVIHLPN